MQRIGRLPISEQTLYAVRFHPRCLADPAWGEEQFDCYVLNLGGAIAGQDMQAIAREVTEARTDWVHTAGKGCELLHDAIDRMSVSIGRQAQVGEGSPMTSWDEEETTIEKMADLVLEAELGGNTYHLVALFVGPEDLFEEALTAIRSRCNEDNREAQ